MPSLLETELTELANGFGLGGEEKRKIKDDRFSHYVEPLVSQRMASVRVGEVNPV